MEITYINDLKRIYKRYHELTSKISELNNEVSKLVNNQVELKEELTKNRNNEKKIINKIEKELGKKLTQSDLFKILDLHESY